MTLIYEVDTDILKTYLHTGNKNELSMSMLSKVKRDTTDSRKGWINTINTYIKYKETNKHHSRHRHHIPVAGVSRWGIRWVQAAELMTTRRDRSSLVSLEPTTSTGSLHSRGTKWLQRQLDNFKHCAFSDKHNCMIICTIRDFLKHESNIGQTPLLMPQRSRQESNLTLLLEKE